MIRELSVRPTPTNNKSKIYFISALCLSLWTLILYFSVEKYKGIVGLFIIAFLTVAVLIYTKYISAQYYYDITFDSEGAPIFVVRQIIGKRQTTLCRIDLYAIRSVSHLSAEEKKKHKVPEGAVKYAYTPTLIPDSVCAVYVKSNYEHAELIIECSEEFSSLLLSYAEEARRMRAQMDE